MTEIIAPDQPLPPALVNSAVAIGNFDGVHRGHQTVLERAKEIGRAENRPALALTFEPHPRTYFRTDPPVFRLTPVREKTVLFQALGLDAAVIKNFDARLAALAPEEFFETLLLRELQAKHIVVGADFHFGRDRAGTPALLRQLAEAAGIRVSFVPPVVDAYEAISSSRIRLLLEACDIPTANALLGYRWFVSGEVVKGNSRGRALGIPTANMLMPENFSLAHGVYAGRACADGFWFAAAIHYGARLQFGGGPPVLEAHLLDFNGDLYGKTLRVEFMAHMRGEEKFASTAALVEQMQGDIARARADVTGFLKKPQTGLQSKLDEACASAVDAG